MTREQRDKILKAIAEDRNNYVRDCNTRVSKEDGKIIGAEYMLQRFFDILRTEVDSKESDDILEAIRDNCRNSSRCRGCKYFNADTVRCRLVGVPSEWEVE